jgi:uncharacterized protein (DUF1697 family)
MQTYIAILRGINVSGKNKIAMKDLKAALEGAGFLNVATYIQSGNVVFGHKLTDEKTLANQITQLIKTAFGLDVPVLVRTANDIEQTYANNPFLKQKGIDADKLHITYLADVPAQENIDKANTYNYGPDEFIIMGNNVYVHCPNGYGNTKLNNTFFENKLKVAATTRNLKTAAKLVEMGLGR